MGTSCCRVFFNGAVMNLWRFELLGGSWDLVLLKTGLRSLLTTAVTFVRPLRETISGVMMPARSGH